MAEKQMNIDDTQEEYLDTLVKLAFQQREALEIQKLFDDFEKESFEDEALAASAYEQFQKRIAKQSKQKNNRLLAKRNRQIISRIIEVAACLVLVLGIAAPIAIANVESVRVKVMQMLIRIDEGHVSIDLTEDENAAFDVPGNWQGEYFPSYIPEEFSIESISNRIADIYYKDANGRNICFSEYTISTSTDLNSENGIITYDDVNGSIALVIELDNYVSIVWSDGTKYFILDAELPKDEVLQIARSVRRIN
ncbi:MAG: DUF4367 domain-containing protein, partial [Kiritimatiellae bacterium]|nr:DUF4367 domain-containing protein [Kiritimatiellia bacterium]